MGLWVLRRDGVIWSRNACQQIGLDGQPLPDQEYLEDDAPELIALREAEANPVPRTAAAGDFMRALYELGWYDDAKAAVEAAGGLAQILWDRAATFERNHPLVAQTATAIGKTPDDLDDLFRKAASYTA
jgi:hypothetical protein